MLRMWEGTLELLFGAWRTTALVSSMKEDGTTLLKSPLGFENIGRENFGEWPAIRQIRQYFPTPKFSHVRYIYIYIHSNI